MKNIFYNISYYVEIRTLVIFSLISIKFHNINKRVQSWLLNRYDSVGNRAINRKLIKKSLKTANKIKTRF